MYTLKTFDTKQNATKYFNYLKNNRLHYVILSDTLGIVPDKNGKPLETILKTILLREKHRVHNDKIIEVTDDRVKIYTYNPKMFITRGNSSRIASIFKKYIDIIYLYDTPILVHEVINVPSIKIGDYFLIRAKKGVADYIYNKTSICDISDDDTTLEDILVYIAQQDDFKVIDDVVYTNLTVAENKILTTILQMKCVNLRESRLFSDVRYIATCLKGGDPIKNRSYISHQTEGYVGYYKPKIGLTDIVVELLLQEFNNIEIIKGNICFKK